ncbi:hypothetical protein [Sporosarcina sp. ZBG7A]|uniref:hypothetical protein n=1 Tax=Sporosarcina sp. ZBG7A TaxID=1582223 RepID=UPI0012E0ACF1|nr:hypothetical protein [Sporosarcina sp. ZBG7A]
MTAVIGSFGRRIGNMTSGIGITKRRIGNMGKIIGNKTQFRAPREKIHLLNHKKAPDLYLYRSGLPVQIIIAQDKRLVTEKFTFSEKHRTERNNE